MILTKKINNSNFNNKSILVLFKGEINRIYLNNNDFYLKNNKTISDENDLVEIFLKEQSLIELGLNDNNKSNIQVKIDSKNPKKRKYQDGFIKDINNNTIIYINQD